MTSRTPNPRSELISKFRDGYVEDMQDEHEQAVTEGPEAILESIEAFLRVGFEASAKEKIDELEETYGIDFESLASECQAAHLRDIRGE